ncbi:MAG: hypothetical protein WCV90_07970 [Candidatus Woesearchaeota archaeon]
MTLRPAKLTCINPGLEQLVIPLTGHLPLVIGQGEFDQDQWEERLIELFDNKPVPEAFLSPFYLPIPQLQESGLYALVRTIQLPVFNQKVYAISQLDPRKGVYVDKDRVTTDIKIGRHLTKESHVVTFGNSEEKLSFRFSYETQD